MTGFARVVVIVNGAVELPAEFVAVSVTLFVPVTVDLPVIKPVAVLTVSPAGRPLAS
jgi:hypothetical protein